MAAPCIISKEARQYIIDHCTLTSKELKEILFKEYQVDVSEVAIWEHMKVARQRSEEATRTADAHLSQTIAERVNSFAPVILERYEKELKRIASVLDGTSNEFILETGEDGSRDKFWATKYTKLFDDLAKSYLALRPPITTVRIESTTDPDVALMDTWTDDQMKKYEEFLKSLKTNKGD
jgi:hypothetical protein